MEGGGVLILRITPEALTAELRQIGVHEASIGIFSQRSAIEPLKLFGVRTPAANVLKQEMLSAGSDCAVHCHTIDCREATTDVLLLGTRKHYVELLRKLRPMQFLGLPELAAELAAFLCRTAPVTQLADGRILTYERMLVMGIVNATPDSFFAASRAKAVDDGLKRAAQMLEDGADILDIGGESTRPGSDPVSVEGEIARVAPLIEAVKKRFPSAVLSVDTYRAATAQAAIDAGADIINDISAMESDAAMAATAVKNAAPVILMHMKGTPRTMQDNPVYQDVVRAVTDYLQGRIGYAKAQGLKDTQLLVDPGIGFGKTVEHNLMLMKRLREFTSFGLPVLLAASRKGTIGQVLGGLPPEERLEGTLATTAQAVACGAQMVRVHDVKEHVRLVRMLEAIRQCP